MLGFWSYVLRGDRVNNQSEFELNLQTKPVLVRLDRLFPN